MFWENAKLNSFINEGWGFQRLQCLLVLKEFVQTREQVGSMTNTHYRRRRVGGTAEKLTIYTPFFPLSDAKNIHDEL